MRGFFAGRRWKSGVVTLIVALVFTGAWVKCGFDKTVICYANGNQVDELSTAGKIGVFCCSRRIKIIGLYRESFTLSLWCRPDAEPANPIVTLDAVDFSFEIPPPWATSDDAKVTPVSFQPETSVEATQIEERTGISFDEDKQVVFDDFGNSYPMDPEFAKEIAEGEIVDDGLTTSRWQAFGFYTNWTESRDGRWSLNILFPHASVVIPLALLSAYLIVSKPKSTVC